MPSIIIRRLSELRFNKASSVPVEPSLNTARTYEFMLLFAHTPIKEEKG